MPKLHDFRTNFRFGRLKDGFRMRQDARSYKASVRNADNFMVLGNQTVRRRWGTDYVSTLAAECRIEGWVWGSDETEANLICISDSKLEVLSLDGTVAATFTVADIFYDLADTYTLAWTNAEIPFIQIEAAGNSVWITDVTFPPLNLKREDDGTFSLNAFVFGLASRNSLDTADVPFYSFDPDVELYSNVWLGRGYGDTIQDRVIAQTGFTKDGSAFDNPDGAKSDGYGTMHHENNANYFTADDIGQRFRLQGGEFEVISLLDDGLNTRTRIRVIENLTIKLDNNPIFTTKNSNRVEIAIPNHGLRDGNLFMIFGVSTQDATQSVLPKAMDNEGNATTTGVFAVNKIVDENHIQITDGNVATADALIGGASVEIIKVQNPGGLYAAGIATIGLEEPVFSKKRGWPQTAAVWQSRLFFAGSPSLPDSAFGSAINDFTDFNAGTGLDDEALTLYGLGGGGRILHCDPGYDLTFLTSKGEYYIPGSNDVAITPSTIRAVNAKTNIGSSYTPIVSFDGTVFHMDAPGKHLRALSSNEGEYASRVMTIGSPDWVAEPSDSAMFAGGTEDATPYAMLVNGGDGSMIVIHSSKEDDSFGVMRWSLDAGSFVSVAGVFNKLFCVAEIDGSYVLMEFDTRDESNGLDFAQRFSADTGNATVTHSLLASREVQATEDGVVVLGESVTAGGVYTKATAAADEVIVGLGSEWLLEITPPIAASGQGSKAGKMVNLVDAEILFLETTTGEVEGEPIVEWFDQLDAAVAPTPVSDFRHYVIGKWDRTPTLTLSGNEPGEIHIEALTLNVYF